MRGLPFKLRIEELIEFFNSFDIYPESIKIGRNQDNTLTGEGAILFKTEQECLRAKIARNG